MDLSVPNSCGKVSTMAGHMLVPHPGNLHSRKGDAAPTFYFNRIWRTKPAVDGKKSLFAVLALSFGLMCLLLQPPHCIVFALTVYQWHVCNMLHCPRVHFAVSFPTRTDWLVWFEMCLPSERASMGILMISWTVCASDCLSPSRLLLFELKSSTFGATSSWNGVPHIHHLHSQSLRDQ